MIPCFLNLGTGELVIIFAVVILLFGAKRIPELARSMGKGISMFKQGMNEATSQINEPVDKKADSSTAGNQNQTQGSDAK
ncbi:twin-arginine translocase TatA/TatE family subunit [uncultured Duncaniella sp.]|uniref:Sec-independent protein translocase subunit TatA/TatB n=1 Tax=uncultured Duncaniella sp. TaxID=2768039 RepID=UPI0025F5F793|nr:twin-arginine translocase TatA/TatE family subunit [uncultured Duncaniella sp.]